MAIEPAMPAVAPVPTSIKPVDGELKLALVENRYEAVLTPAEAE
jgi:hypothetical protein